MSRKRLSTIAIFVAAFYTSHTFLFSVSDAFELLPYVHIDYLHYARLAQCQAKCAQTYGTLSRRRLNDGSQRAYVNTSSEHYDICETGCVVHSRGSSPAIAQEYLDPNMANNLDASLFDALRRGQNFWWESVVAQNGAANVQLPSTKNHEKLRKTARLFDGIQVLCIQRSADEDKRTHISQAYKPSVNLAGNVFRTRFGLPKSSRNTPTYRRSLTNAIKRRQLVFIDAYDAVLSARFAERDSDDIKNDSVQATIRDTARYIVLWRQKTKVSIGEIIDRDNENETIDNASTDESTTGWITAAIEASSTFRVEGIQSGMLYRFMLVPILADGRPTDYGTPIKSDWIDFQTLVNAQKSQKQTPASLYFFSHFNAHDQVGAVARWFTFDDIHGRRLPPDHPQLTPSTTIIASSSLEDMEYARQMRHSASTTRRRFTYQRPLIFEGCQLQIEYWNKTSRVLDVFDVDESDGITLKNLAFASEYTVRIQSADQQNNKDSKNNNIEKDNDSITAEALTGTFTSLSCAQVHGAGSIECDPEPVRNVAVQINDKNETFVTVTWTPAADARYILLYQLYCAPIATSSTSCAVPSMSLFLTANTTEAELGMSSAVAEECTFELRITNYDLLGRDASATVQFTYTPPGRQSSISSVDRIITEVMLPWLQEQGRMLRQHAAITVLISVAISVLIIAIVLIILTARHNAAKKRVWFRRWRTPSTSASTTASASSLPSSTVAVINEKDLSVRVIVEV